MRVGSLFSGIGGLEYGLERSGLSTSCEWMIEMDEYCCSVLEKNFPNTLIINKKVEDINPLDLPEIDILTAGFPCQPVSVAGSRKGVTDDRWLWDEVWRFIDVLRPRYFILENVPGLFTANKGKAFERVIKDIAKSRSYRFEWQIISARTVGAAHLRKRFFGVGTLGNSSIKSNVATNRSITTISQERNTRKDNVRETSGRQTTRAARKKAELWMGSTAYGFPGWMARLGIRNVWSINVNDWRTPTTMDKKEDALKHATKLLQGKDTRASGESVQITLADQIAMEDIKNNPKLYEKYKDHMILKRPYLPKQKLFVDYLRSVTSVKELDEQTEIKKTTIEHWFRYDDKGFSFPSLEDWETIKPLLKEIKYDKELSYVIKEDWTDSKVAFPTATARDWKDTYGTKVERNTLPLNIFKKLKEDIKDFSLWEYGMPRSMEDYPDRKARLMALGNAVVPQCVELVGRLIKRADELGTMVFDIDIKENK